MCGITGYLSTHAPAREMLVEHMAAQIAHRGPDASAVWFDTKHGLAFGHRRLSIVDLSPAGQQPMHSADGRLVIVFNGEIYNHHSLRREVEATGWATAWRGHSDTETLLAALQLWGVAGTLPKLNGMFAFALWDRQRRVLALARDRLGEKPLFYGQMGETFLFGSELKALGAHPDWRGEIDRNVLAVFFRHAYVPDPHCIYRGIFKLPPAHWLEVVDGKVGAPIGYWSLAAATQVTRRTEPPQTLVTELEQRLMQAVGLRMEADVPLGAFLSGGIDSSTIVALMQAQAKKPVRTFTKWL